MEDFKRGGVDKNDAFSRQDVCGANRASDSIGPDSSDSLPVPPLLFVTSMRAKREKVGPDQNRE